MSKSLEKGMRLHAMYTDGEYYPATVKNPNQRKGDVKGAVVVFDGYPLNVWIALENLKTKTPRDIQAKAQEAEKHISEDSLDDDDDDDDGDDDDDDDDDDDAAAAAAADGWVFRVCLGLGFV